MKVTSSSRESQPILLKMLLMWCFTVYSLIPKWVAMSRFRIACVNAHAMSISRGVRLYLLSVGAAVSVVVASCCVVSISCCLLVDVLVGFRELDFGAYNLDCFVVQLL